MHYQWKLLKKMEKNRYYIVDYGKDSREEITLLAETVVNALREQGSHIVIYLTDLPNSLMVTEATEDEFLEHFITNN